MSAVIDTPLLSKPSFTWKGAKLNSSLFVLIFGVVLWFSPPPSGLSLQVWHLFAIFLATIVGVIAKPLPMGCLAILAISACTLTNTLTIEQTLSSFSSPTVWLILIAFLLARGFIKTGLGSRVAYQFVYYIGRNTIGLCYGLVLTEFLLSPFVPSNTARGAGIIFPLVNSLSKEYKSDPKDGTQDRIGSYLVNTCFHANIITSTIFLTAMAANPIITSFALEMGVNISWLTWAKAAIVPGLVSILSLPLVMYFINPPSIKQTPEAREFAQQKLRAMGPISFDEKFMLATFGILLFLWIFGGAFGVSATTAAFVGLSMLLFSGVLTWDDILSEKNGWNTFIWLTTLLMMTTYLAKFGMMSWFGDLVGNMVKGMHWGASLAILLLIYYYSHYLFASMTAHITSMYSAFTMVAIASGTPPMLAALLFAFFSNLSSCTTHYGTGTAPVYYGLDYVSFANWWRIGAIMSIVHIVIWLGVGLPWLKLLNVF